MNYFYPLVRLVAIPRLPKTLFDVFTALTGAIVNPLLLVVRISSTSTANDWLTGEGVTTVFEETILELALELELAIALELALALALALALDRLPPPGARLTCWWKDSYIIVIFPIPQILQRALWSWSCLAPFQYVSKYGSNFSYEVRKCTVSRVKSFLVDAGNVLVCRTVSQTLYNSSK